MGEVRMYAEWIERLKKLGFHAVKLDEPVIHENVTDGFGGFVKLVLWWYIADADGNNVNGTPWQTEDLAWEHVYTEERDVELLEIRNELSHIYFSSEDKQVASDKADKLLLRAFRAIESNSGEDDLITLVEQVAAAYERIKQPK